MRNPERIDKFMKELMILWKENFPDWRFGQFISNFIRWYGDPFFLEEPKFLLEVETFIEEMKAN